MSLYSELIAKIGARWPLGRSRTTGARRAGSRGITLIELLVVLALIAIIGAFAVPALMERFEKSKVDAAAIQIDKLGGILEIYRLDVGRYPRSDEGLQSLLTQPPGVDRWAGPYLQNAKALTDPWGNPYQYRSPGENGAYDLYSLGADGTEGGDGNNADITSW